MASDLPNGPSSPIAAPPVTVQILSPSLQAPLRLSSLPRDSTLKQLKARIREAVPHLGPADEDQRLIFNGRVLVQETDTLQGIFGDDGLAESDQPPKTILLVIKEGAQQRAPSISARTTREQSPAPRPMPHSHRAPSPFAHATARDQSPIPPSSRSASATRQAGHPGPNIFGYVRRPNAPGTMPQPRVPSPSPTANATPEQAAAFQHQHQNLTGWLTNVQRDAARTMQSQQDVSDRATIEQALQNQIQRAESLRQVAVRIQAGHAERGRRPFSVHGPGDNAGQTTQANGPAPSYTTYRDALGPNGQPYRIETTVRSMGGPHPGLSAAEAQQVLQSADSRDVRRSDSVRPRASSRRAVGQTNAPGSSTRTASAPLTTGPGHSGSGTENVAAPPAEAPRAPVEVYLLSSPDGPRALMVNNTTCNHFYTPRPRQPPNIIASGAGHGIARHRIPPQFRQQADARQPRIELGHPRNPAHAGLVPLFVQMWPHLWLLARLGLFIWVLTAPGVSYSRWVAIVSLAALVFFISTGLLNNLVEQVWRPIGRHVENLLPAIDQRAGVGAQEQPREEENRQAGPAPGPGANLDPAQAAARWMAQQRQGQETWLGAQFRRIERAGLLFLASIAPGVAERHIENLELAQRQARELRERAERALAAAAAAAEPVEPPAQDESQENPTEARAATEAGTSAEQTTEPQAQAESEKSQVAPGPATPPVNPGPA